MKKIYNILLLVAGLFTACENEVPQPGNNNIGDEVQVNILPPRITTAAQTRSDWPDNGMPKERMPGGSTIRLYIYNAEATSGRINPVSNNLFKEMTFRVRGVDEISSTPDDQRAVVPCEVNPDTGEPIGDITNTDLHLPASLYDFFAISPAIKLNNWPVSSYQVPGLEFDHGGIMPEGATTPITLYTTQPLRGVQIGSNDPQVTGGTEGVYNLTLEPFTLLSSRVKFIIMPGKDVDDLEVEDRGVVMSNLSYNSFNYNFLIGDTTLMETLLASEEAAFGTVSTTYARSVEGEEKGYEPGKYPKYSWELVTELIPNPQSGRTEFTDVDLTFNLLINNGNYKSYDSYLIGQRFDRGMEYTYIVTVNAGGIFVRGWRNVGWTATIPR